MLISREREKLLEAVKYFAAHTKYCGITKLFKLLYFLDFDHFRETGRSVTGLQYQAWPMGPVPADLYQEVNGRPGQDMAAHIKIDGPSEISVETNRQTTGALNTFGESSGRETTNVRVPAKIKAIKPFKAKVFTKRELRLMEMIAFVYNELTAAQISEASHLKGQPWHVTVKKHGTRAHIDYMLALDERREGAPSKEEILARIEERSEVLNAFK
jgi:uncharacterized phage-associated protein